MRYPQLQRAARARKMLRTVKYRNSQAPEFLRLLRELLQNTFPAPSAFGRFGLLFRLGLGGFLLAFDVGFATVAFLNFIGLLSHICLL